MCQKSRTHLAKIHSWQCLFESLNPWGYETIEVRNIVPHDLIDPSACTFMNWIYPDGRLERKKSPADGVFFCGFFQNLWNLRRKLWENEAVSTLDPWCYPQAVSGPGRPRVHWGPQSLRSPDVSVVLAIFSLRASCDFRQQSNSPTVFQSQNHKNHKKEWWVFIWNQGNPQASLRGCLEIRGPKF